MKNLQNGLKEKICENRITKKCLALLLALSMTVGFVMPYEEVFESAIMSAVAAGKEDSNGNYMTEAYDQAPAGADDFGDKITTVIVNGQNLKGGDVIVASGNQQSINATLNYEYGENEVPVDLDHRYIYYEFKGVKLNDPEQGEKKIGNDQAWADEFNQNNPCWDPLTKRIPCYYSISKDGLLVIKFTKSYINDKICGPNGDGTLKGYAYVNGYVERDATATGDKIISFGDKKLTVQFDDVIKEGSKTSAMATDASGNPVVHYTIQVENPGKNIDFTKYNFTDSLINSANKDKISGVKSNPAGCITYDNNGNINFTAAAKDNSRFTIEYDYKPTIEELKAGTKLTNNVTIVNPNDDKDKAETSDEITLDPNSVKATITKSGTPSYESDTSNTGYIEWKIEVEGKYNFSLKDYFVTDEAFKLFNDNTSDNKKAEIVSVKDENGNDVAYSPNSHDSTDWDNGKLTINGDAKKVIITYKTFVDNNGKQLEGQKENVTVNNTANVTPPNGTTPDDEGGDDVTYVEKSSVKKSGENKTIDGYDKLNKPAEEETTLKWTANITDFNGIQDGKTYTDTLNGDQYFKDDLIDRIVLTSQQTGSLTKGTDYNIELLENKKSFTITFIGTDKVKATKNLTISYQSFANTIGIGFNGTAKFTNHGVYDGTPDDGEITVTREPDPYASKEKFSFGADKRWVGVSNPPELYFKLQYKIGESGSWTDYLNAQGTIDYKKVSDNWDYWNNLPKTDTQNNVIYYRVVEMKKEGNDYSPFDLEDYTVSYNYSDFNFETGITADQYAGLNGRLQVTNTYKYFDASINKSWVNIPNDNAKFDVTFTLWKKVGNGEWEETNKTMPLTVGQNSVRFEKLPKEENGQTVYYKVVENASGSELNDYTVTYNNVEYANITDAECITATNSTMAVTNTYNKIGVKVVKNWEGDDNNSANSRPSDDVGITVTLKKSIDGGTTWSDCGTATLTSADNWTHIFEDLPKKDGNNVILYKVIETKVDGYTKHEQENPIDCSNINSYVNNYEITNTWDKITIKPQKKWVGDAGKETSRPGTIEFKLQFKLGEGGTWTDASESTVDDIKNKANITITVDKTANVDTQTAENSWKSLPKEVGGEKIYYRAVEVSVDGKYYETYDNNGLNQTGISTVTNTLNTISITPAKEWKGDEGNTDKRENVTLELEWKFKGETSWRKITDATYGSTLFKNVTATQIIKKTDGDTWTGNAWDNLPKTYLFNGQRKTIEYHVIETSTNENYTSEPSAVLSGNGTATVRNTYNYITITASKVWAGDTADKRPDTITVHLEQSTDNGNKWDLVENSEETITIDKSQSPFTLHSWSNLPKKIDGKEVLYKVVESPVSGYNTTYSENISGNSGTITVTNTKKGDYSKLALSPEPHESGKKSFDELKATEITSIKADDLKNITKKDAVINGETKSCYIFKWMVIFPKNEVVDYVDELPANSVFYVENTADSLYKPSVGGQYIYPWIIQNDSNGDIRKHYEYPYNNDYGKVRFHFTDGNGNEIIDTQNVKCIVYYTATPVEIVDAAVASTGYYELNNTIRRKDDTKGETATLTIGSKESTPTGSQPDITKEYTDNDDVNVKAGYTVYINPDAIKLSSEDYLDVSDIFEVTKYKTPKGVEHTGPNLLDATILDVEVFDMDKLDAKGKPTPVTDFTLFPADTREETVVTELKNDNYEVGVQSGNNWIYIRAKAQPIAQGNTFTFKITGTPNTEFSINDSQCAAEPKNGTFDSKGEATINITLNEELTAWNMKSFAVYKRGTSTTMQVDYTVKSAGLIQKFEKTTNTLKVPDEKHLKITYYYELRVNENTPADSGETPLKIGAKPPAGATVYFKNEASLETSNGTKKDETDENNFVIQQAGIGVSTGVLPSIEKINIGNEAENNLAATFKLAKFDNTTKKWVYASGFGDSSTIIPAYVDGNLNETNNTVPAGAADLSIKGNQKINLADNTLYKLVETVSPEGYKQTPYKEGISLDSAEMKDFVFYFVYARNAETAISSIATNAGINAASIMDIKSGKTIKVKNINLIDISVGKTWAQVPKSANKVISKFELFYSFKRPTKTNPIPVGDDLKSVSELGIKSPTKEIEFEINNGVMTQKIDAETLKWAVLPNGKDGEPIYYYIKEISYTIDDKTYELQTDGSYKYGNEIGDYNGLYTGNAANTTSTIECTNTKGIYVQKEWLNSDNSLMSSAPVDSIQFKFYGKTADGTLEEIDLGNSNVLSEDNKWQQLIPSEKLADYVDFKVEEVKKDANGNDLGVTLYGYKISYTKNLNGTSGVLTISNKNPNMTNINFIVNKEWGDGLDASKHTEEITVTLYRSETAWAGYTPTDAEKNASTPVGSVILSAEKGWSYTWENLDNLQDNGHPYFYYAVESVPKNYDASYSQSGSSSTKVVTITNTPKPVDGKLTVSKEWDKVNTTNQKPVTLELYRRRKALTTSAYTFPADITIACAGDSITQGTYGNTYNSKTQGSYPAELARIMKLVCGSWQDGISVANNGQDSRQIDAMSADLTKLSYNKDAQIVCIIIGTNNIIHENVDTPESAYGKLVTYIESIQSGHTIFLASIPHVKSGTMFNGNVTTTNANIDSYNTLIENYVNTQNNNNLIFVDINEVIADNYICDDGIHPNNAGYTKIAETFYNAIGEKFGTKNNVDTSVQTDIDNVPTDLTATNTAYEKVEEVTLNSENNWTKTWTNLPTTFKGDDGIEYQWIYYVKEVKPAGASWEVSYSHNGQPAKGQTAITVTNTGTDDTPKAPVKVTKKWLADGKETNVHPAEIKVQLYSSTSENGNYTLVAGNPEETLNAGNNWTATWENLETGLYYKAVETAIAGWEQSSTAVKLMETSTTDNPAEIVLTNTLEKGSLEIQKSWLEGTQANADEVEVELYRVAVDENGNPVSETPQTADVMALSSADNMYSLSRAKTAIARLSEQNEVQEEQITLYNNNPVTIADAETRTAESSVPFKTSFADNTKYNFNITETITKIEIVYTDKTGQYDFTSFNINDSYYFQHQGSTSYTITSGDKDYNGNVLTSFSNITFWNGSAKHIEKILLYYTPQGPQITSWETPEGTDFTVGDMITIPAPTATGDGVKFSYSCDKKDGISIVGNQATFSKAGNYTITATATDSGNLTATDTKVYHISDFQIITDITSITEGETINLSKFGTNAHGGEIDWSATGAVTYANGIFTAVGSGNATITATRRGPNITASAIYTVQDKDFSLSTDKAKLHVGGTAQLSVEGVAIGDVEFDYDHTIFDISTVNSDGTVTVKARKECPAATITAKRGTKSSAVTIEVENMKIKFNNELATELIRSLNINSSLEFEIVGAIGKVEANPSNTEIAYVEGNYIKTTAKENKSATITFTDEAGASLTVTININKITKIDVDFPAGAEPEQVTNVGTNGRITISKNKEWKETVENLPTTDGNGHYYQYYIKEVDSDKYIPISYSNNGAELNNTEKHAVIELTNKPTETSSVELPSVGGTGTLPYTATGLSLMATSAAIMFIRRRKRRSA